MAAAILLFCFQGAGRKLSTECRPVAEKVRRLGAKGTKEQGFAGICAPSPRRPSAVKVRRLGAKGTKEQGFAGVCAPNPCWPSAEKVRRVGAKGTKEQGAAGICAPSRHRPSVNPGPKNRKGRPWHRPSWRPIAGKTLYLRCEAPTFCPGAQPVTGRVGAPLPAKPYASVTGRQHFTLRLGRQPAKFALGCPQSQ